MGDFVYLKTANDIPLFLDDSFREVAPQNLSNVDSNRIAILKLRCCAHRLVADHDRPISFDHFKNTDSLIVIAKNLQHHVAARARRKQNIVSLEPARIVRNQILRFRRLELKSTAERASAPTQ